MQPNRMARATSTDFGPVAACSRGGDRPGGHLGPVDHLRGVPAATALLVERRSAGPLHASEMTRLEVLAGTRPAERTATDDLLGVLTWHPLDTQVAEMGGALGRRWLPSHSGIDAADLAIAATADLLGVALLTLNVRHFPMFAGLTRPY